jgi:hypothetical protein
MKNNIVHICLALVFLALLVLLSDPFMLWMPAEAQMAVLLGATVLACVWVGFVMFEKTDDEREAIHRMHAGRIAYLSGVAVLTVGLLFQGLAHSIDPWLTLALGAMVSMKLVSRIYSQHYQ